MRIVFGNIFITAISDDRLEVVTENVVVKSGLKFFDHLRRVRMGRYFQFVHFSQFYGMEKRVFNADMLQSDTAVADKVHQSGALQYRHAIAGFSARRIGSLHQFVKAFFFQSGDGHDGHADLFFKTCRVDLIAAFFYLVHHVERDHERYVDLHQLGGEIQVSFQIGRVDYIDDAIGFFVQNKVTRNDFFGRVRRQRINTGKVYDRNGFRTLFVQSFSLIYGNARPVADVSRRARQVIE